MGSGENFEQRVERLSLRLTRVSVCTEREFDIVAGREKEGEWMGRRGYAHQNGVWWGVQEWRIYSPGELARDELDCGRRVEGSTTRNWTIGGGSIGRRSAGMARGGGL